MTEFCCIRNFPPTVLFCEYRDTEPHSSNQLLVSWMSEILFPHNQALLGGIFALDFVIIGKSVGAFIVKFQVQNDIFFKCSIGRMNLAGNAFFQANIFACCFYVYALRQD